jgi:hypothetical protein
MSEREISPLEDKLLGQAVANTENEIFNSAMDRTDPDEADEGDRSVEEMGEGLEGQHEAEVAEDGDEAEGEEAETDGEEEAEAEKPAAETKPEAKDRDDKGQFVPRARLTEEATKRREVEERERTATDRASKLESDLAAVNKRLDDLLARPAPQPQPVAAKVEPAAPVAKPDMFTEPEKYEAWVLDQARQNAAQEMGKVVTERFVSASMADAHETHGDEFVKAYENLTGINPVTQQVVRQVDRSDPVRMGEIQRVINAPNPGRALMNWQRQQATLARVGTDPAKFEESIRNETREALMKDPEFRKQLLESMKSEAASADNGRPRTVTRLPKSLNDVSGGQSAHIRNPADFDDSEEGVFDDVWSDRKAG